MPTVKVIGHVREDSAAHVLFRLPWRSPDGNIVTDDGKPKVATFTEVDSEWRLELEPFSRLGMPGFEHIIHLEDHT